ncbi:hypothetical protein NDU88_002036 [Pleurodeles waltl]|uniref:Uncharacterized protein n=1 Tax=Pleurodeles waltl TaxID=8319 RepID=A0AAV7UUE1_PLEWA|nr:hypothetical protein NDU88_002036 [Pleurodeles waltl]
MSDPSLVTANCSSHRVASIAVKTCRDVGHTPSPLTLSVAAGHLLTLSAILCSKLLPGGAVYKCQRSGTTPAPLCAEPPVVRAPLQATEHGRGTHVTYTSLALALRLLRAGQCPRIKQPAPRLCSQKPPPLRPRQYNPKERHTQHRHGPGQGAVPHLHHILLPKGLHTSPADIVVPYAS